MVIALDSTEYHSGTYSIHITGDGSGWVAPLRVFKDFDCTKDYVLSAWVKTNNCKSSNSTWKGPRFEVQFYQSAASTKSITSPAAIEGTFDWQKVELELPSETLTACNNGADTGNMQIIFDCNASSGEIWIDDLELVCTGTPETPDPDPDPSPSTDPDPDPSPSPEPSPEPSDPPAELEGYPNPTAEWTDSFETTASAPAGNVTTYWKNATIPTGWDQMWVATAPSSPEKMYFEVVNDVKAHGNSSVHIHSEDAGGRICVFPLAAGKLDYSKDYILRMRIKSEDVTGTGVYFRVQVGSKYNKNVFSMSRKVTGTTDWTEYEIEMKNIAALAEDTSGNFKLEIFAEYMTGDAWVDAIEFIPLDASGGIADVIFNEDCEQTVTDGKWENSVAPKYLYDLGWPTIKGEIKVSVDSTTAHSGTNSILIVNPDGNANGSSRTAPPPSIRGS